jgi:hypothetical protein
MWLFSIGTFWQFHLFYWQFENDKMGTLEFDFEGTDHDY